MPLLSVGYYLSQSRHRRTRTCSCIWCTGWTWAVIDPRIKLWSRTYIFSSIHTRARCDRNTTTNTCFAFSSAVQPFWLLCCSFVNRASYMFTSVSYVRNIFFVRAAYVHEYHYERTAASSSTRVSRFFIVLCVCTYIGQFALTLIASSVHCSL